MTSKTHDFLREWKYKNIVCRVIGGPFSNFNGYVGLPKSNPAWGRNYFDLDIEVHGGLTFGEQGADDSLRFPNSNLWWFGFDTAHSGDWVDYGTDSSFEKQGHKWTAEEVSVEVENMAKQFSKLVSVDCQQSRKNKT